MAGLRAPEWGTELGRLYLEGTITSAMYAAGKRWREWAADYRQAIGTFPVRTAALEQGRRGPPIDPDSPDGQEIAKRERDAAERFFAADAVLAHAELSYPGVRLLVRRVCEDNESPCGFAELMRFRTGLIHLVSHWGLTATDKNEVKK